MSSKMLRVLVVAAGAMFVCRAASALSVAGSAGSLFSPSSTNLTCMQSFGGTIKNTCSTNLGWIIALAVNQGSHTVAVSGTNASGTLECGLFSETQSGGGSGAVFATFPGGTTVQNLTVTVPSNGILFLECGVGASDTINSVNYAQ
jgi:hypothetical protein